MFGDKWHRYFLLLGTLVIIVGLIFSPFLLSQGQFILLGNWILELNYRTKIKTLFAKKSVLFFISFYLLHILWLFNTSDFCNPESETIKYAIHDLKIKLPLLFLPIIYGSTYAFNIKELKFLFNIFILNVFVGTVYSTIVYMGFTGIDTFDKRNISVFISHIRFALLIDFAIFLLTYMLVCYKAFLFFKKYLYYIIIGWLLFYTLFLGAFTGIMLLGFVVPFMIIFWLGTKENKIYRSGVIISLALIFISIFIYTYLSYQKFSKREIVNISDLKENTINGNKYQHYPEINDYENNYCIWIYISDAELQKEWNKISTFKFKDKDKRGQPIRGTIIRYLTSLGYSKDSIGLSMLNKEDITMIENGSTNYILNNKLSVYSRLYQIFWEIEYYNKYGDPSGHSLTQRIEYFKNGVSVIKRNFWFGTGIGDVDKEIKYQYEIDNSILKDKWRKRTHNQILTFFLTFGIVGFSLLCFVFYKVLKIEKKQIDFLTLSFLLIVLFSMLNEDTLETQAGVSFFAFFFSILFFGRRVNRLK